MSDIVRVSQTSDLLADAKRAADHYVDALKAGERLTHDAFKVLDPAFQRALVLRHKQFSSLTGLNSSGSWLRGFLQETSAGGWQRNEEVNLNTVLSNPTLYACITLIAGDIAKLRPTLVEQDADGIWFEVESDAFSPFLRKPNAYQTRIDFYEWWLMSKLIHGNTYAVKARDGRNVVTAAYIVDPSRVTPLLAPDGSVFYRLEQDQLARIEKSVVVPAREMFHDVMCPLFHPLVGVSQIYAAGFPAVEGLNIRHASNKFLMNGSRPGGVLLIPTEISQDEANDMKTEWKASFGGDNQGDVAVLTGGMKYQPMAIPAQQSQLIEQLRMTDEDIAKCFHMPRHKVGIGPDPTYNNIEALNQQYYTDCLQKLIEKLELTLDEGLGLTTVPGRRLGVEFDLDDLLRMDSAGRNAAAEKAIKSGLSPNEVRFRYHDAGPVVGGEVPFMQEQNWPIRLLAARELPSDRPPTAPASVPSVLDPDKQLDLVALSGLVRQKVLALRAAS